MKKIRYSAGIKAILLALQELLSVMLVICVVIVTTLFDSSMLDFRDLQNGSFWSSGYYNTLFARTMRELMEYQIYKGQFETAGSYNASKAVNVIAYMDTHTGSHNRGSLAEQEKFRYYLVDLEDWSRIYDQVVCQVEEQLYTTADGALHQKQVLYSGDRTVKESEIQIESLADMDFSLLQMIVSNAEYYYGGNYNLENYRNTRINGSGAIVYTEVEAQSGAEFSSGAAEQGEETKTAGGRPSDAAEDGERAESAEELPSDEAEDGDRAEPGQVEPLEAVQEETAELETTIQKIRDGKLLSLGIEELKLILEDLNLLGNTTVSEFQGIREDYLTVDQTSIMGEYLAGTITLDEMKQAYEGLTYTLTTIGEEINAYRRLSNRFGQEESNFKFWIYDEMQNQYYTNLSVEERAKELLSYGKELGSYFYYNKAEIRLDTNVRGMEDIFYKDIERYSGAGNQVIFLGVDTSLPFEDNWKSAEQEYLHLQPWTVASLVLSAVSICGLFLSFVYLGLAAGRRPEDDEIHLTWFERIKTEFILIAFGVLGTLIVIVVSRLIYEADTSDTIGVMIMGSGMAFSIIAFFDILFMSLVRRLKAGIMWSGSLLYWFGQSVRKFLANLRPSLRILLAFLLHSAIVILLGMILLSGGYGNNGFVIGFALVAFLLLTAWEGRRFLREGVQRNALIHGIRQIAAGDLEYKIDTKPLKGDNKVMAEAVNNIGDGLFHAVDDGVKNERLKADLITNVSHDIKTPLTSIINYVGLLRRENLENERARNYIQILDAKSQRLKQLTEDLVEVSRISSGNITLQMDRLNLLELVYQIAGEFAERFEERNLTVVTKLPGEPVIIMADGRRIWRVLENLYTNVAKYAMENTRVYVDMEVIGSEAVFSIKNISRQALNIDASELTERFIRGDVSRSTEGSGLGLSIAQNLANLMGGEFRIYLDGDLFKVTVSFPVVKEDAKSEP